MMKMVISCEMEITNVLWNDSLSDPNSQKFIDMKAQLELGMDAAFCNDSTGCLNSICAKKTICNAIKDTLLSYKNGICTKWR